MSILLSDFDTAFGSLFRDNEEAFKTFDPKGKGRVNAFEIFIAAYMFCKGATLVGKHVCFAYM